MDAHPPWIGHLFSAVDIVHITIATLLSPMFLYAHMFASTCEGPPSSAHPHVCLPPFPCPSTCVSAPLPLPIHMCVNPPFPAYPHVCLPPFLCLSTCVFAPLPLPIHVHLSLLPCLSTCEGPPFTAHPHVCLTPFLCPSTCICLFSPGHPHVFAPLALARSWEGLRLSKTSTTSSKLRCAD